jgi:hypothetical protein
MGGLLVAEWSRCPSGHPLSLSLRTDLSILVEDTVCEWCKATAAVMRRHEEQYPDTPAFRDGRFYMPRPKLNGGRRHG